ncbi:hypothetical protein ES319_D08G082000v1 [Gossypium barbadense]|uniref:Uncharacterized protein n=1 Tax=Gossypium barbadense TaxID=3634 RepID=A0A5J5QHH7_GOSBA|nr:hypothetical protein ES319_D08G082000v1 [Gossypium barbadense]
MERQSLVVFKIEPRHKRARPYLNRICSIGSYLCILKLKGDRIPSLVDEPGLCDLSVIIGQAYYSLLLVALQCCSKQILGDFRRQEPNMSFEFAMLPFLSPD